MRIKYATLFGLLAFSVAVLSFSVEIIWIRLGVWLVAFNFALIAIAYGCGCPSLFLKSSSGRLSIASWTLLCPYHLLNLLLLYVVAICARDSSWHKITDGVWLGRRLTKLDRNRWPNCAAVLDLTCEFSEPDYARSRNYLCVRMLDTQPPSSGQINECVDWLIQAVQEGAAYVHCAMGHGRSATIVAAYLLAKGVCNSVEEAVHFVESRRPGAKLNQSQLAALHKYAGVLADRC